MMSIRTRTGYLGRVAVDPVDAEAGEWWYNTTDNAFKWYNGSEVAILGGTYNFHDVLPISALGRPNTNPPTVVDKDNATLLRFTVDTDRVTVNEHVPTKYDSGPISFKMGWTNDGGVDDDGLAVKWQLDYQVAAEGDSIAGSHANSPRVTEDTYVGNVGWIEHMTASVSIPEADFTGKDHLLVKLSAVTPDGVVLSCEPHLLHVEWDYLAKRFPL